MKAQIIEARYLVLEQLDTDMRWQMDAYKSKAKNRAFTCTTHSGRNKQKPKLIWAKQIG
jgi:hypothetical protein